MSVIAPVHIANRDDQAIGAALRRAVDALPDGSYLDVNVVRGRWTATVGPVVFGGTGDVHVGRGDSLEDALRRVAQAMCRHDWRTFDDGQHCVDCGGER